MRMLRRCIGGFFRGLFSEFFGVFVGWGFLMTFCLFF